MFELDDRIMDKLNALIKSINSALESMAKICDDIIKAIRDMVNILETENLRQKANQLEIKPLSHDAFNYVCETYGIYEVYISKENNNPTNYIKYKILI